MIVLPITYKVLRRPRFRSATAYSVVKVQLALANLSATVLPSESSYGYPAWGVPHTNAIHIVPRIKQHTWLLSHWYSQIFCHDVYHPVAPVRDSPTTKNIGSTLVLWSQHSRG